MTPLLASGANGALQPIISQHQNPLQTPCVPNPMAPLHGTQSFHSSNQNRSSQHGSIKKNTEIESLTSSTERQLLRGFVANSEALNINSDQLYPTEQ